MGSEIVIKKCGRCRRNFESKFDNNFCDHCLNEMQEEDNDDEPTGYQCYTCGKSWAHNPGSMPCWDMGCTINEY